MLYINKGCLKSSIRDTISSSFLVSLIEDFNKQGREKLLRALVFARVPSWFYVFKHADNPLLKSSIRDTKKKYAFSVPYRRF